MPQLEVRKRVKPLLGVFADGGKAHVAFGNERGSFSRQCSKYLGVTEFFHSPAHHGLMPRGASAVEYCAAQRKAGLESLAPGDQSGRCAGHFGAVQHQRHRGAQNTRKFGC